eukprot:9486946-Pyramimonas_sp.AAC.1
MAINSQACRAIHPKPLPVSGACLGGYGKLGHFRSFPMWVGAGIGSGRAWYIPNPMEYSRSDAQSDSLSMSSGGAFIGLGLLRSVRSDR